MEAINYSNITMTQIHHMMGGMSTQTENFVICKDYRWENKAPGNTYCADAAAVILCRKGYIKMRVNLREQLLKEGSIMLYGPHNIISVIEKSDDTVCDFIFFSSEFMKDARFDLQTIMPIYKYVSEDSSSLLNLETDEAALMEQYYILLRDSMQFNKQNILREIVSVMMRTISELYARRLEESEHTSVKTRQQEYFERFIKQVALFYREHRSVKFYADSLYITPKYLSTVIKEISGRSAAEWINEFVIQEAKILLNYSTKSIQEITYDLNFSNQSFFGKYFKRHTGVSPSEFRAAKNI